MVGVRPSLGVLVACLSLGPTSTSCDRAASSPRSDAGGTPPAATVGCAHAVCADDFYVDAVPPAACAVGASCSLGLRLVATGAFHVNDDYPYRFKADDAKDVQFLGTDGAGKDVFSKAAGDWRTSGAAGDVKTGVLTVRFSATNPGTRDIGGTFKLSVCSEANCLLEQRHVSAGVVVR